MAILTGSVASAISALIVDSTLNDFSNFLATEANARSASSSTVPLDISMPITLLRFAEGSLGMPWTRCILTALAVLEFCYRNQYENTDLVESSGTNQEWRGSCLKTSKTVMMTSEPSRKTRRVSSAHRWNTPWVPDVPIPSTMSGVIRNGTRSGILRSLPCRNLRTCYNQWCCNQCI